MKKSPVIAKIFLTLFFFTLGTGALAIVFGKIAYYRDPDIFKKVALQIEKRINQGETKNFSETTEQDLKNIYQINIKNASSDIQIESYEGHTLKLLYEGKFRKDTNGDLISVVNQNGVLSLSTVSVEHNFVTLMWNGKSKGLVKTGTDLQTKILLPKTFTGDLQVNNFDGNIIMKNIGVRNLAIKGGNGDVALTLPQNQKYQIEANSVNGDVKIDADLVASKNEKQDKVATVEVKLENGDISIQKFDGAH